MKFFEGLRRWVAEGAPDYKRKELEAKLRDKEAWLSSLVSSVRSGEAALDAKSALDAPLVEKLETELML
jgi:hypothetical protein